MASQQDLMNSSLSHYKKASISFDEWCNRIQNGYQGKPYNYKSTEYYYGGKDMESADHAQNNPPQPPANDTLDDVRGRIFMAGSPLDCLAAPNWMVPVLTADYGNYRSDEDPKTDDEINDWLDDVIKQLYQYFGACECWADCRPQGQGTPYEAAKEMMAEFDLDYAWGQCESSTEFDHGYANGARRMIGNVSVLTTSQLDKVAKAEVLMTAELYRNVQPWMQPDWRNANNGIGGNCIACYASSSEGATYMPVTQYEHDGMYQSGNDCVYGVGLQPADWTNL